MRLHRPRISLAVAAAVLALPLVSLLHAQTLVCWAERCIKDENGVERCTLQPIPCPSQT
jgi:hypothetical protein